MVDRPSTACAALTGYRLTPNLQATIRSHSSSVSCGRSSSRSNASTATSPSSSRPASSHRWNPAAFLGLIANRRAELITKALSSLVTVPCCDASRGFPAAQLMELCSSLRRSAARNDVGHKVSVDPVEDSGIDVSHLEQRRHLWLLLSHSLAFAHTHTNG